MKNFYNKYLPLALAAILIAGSVGIWQYSQPNTAHAAVAFDAYENIGFVGGGTKTATHTASGTHITAVLCLWTQGTITTAPTYGGVTMTLATSSAVTLPFTATDFVYYLPNVPSGASSVSYNTTVSSESGILTVNGSSDTGPDAISPFTSGTTNGSGEAAIPVTTVANNSLEMGCLGSGSNFVSTPSSNGTLLGVTQIGTLSNWITTSTITPAGAFSLKAKTTAGSGVAYNSIGVSIAPFTGGATQQYSADNLGKASLNLGISSLVTATPCQTSCGSVTATGVTAQNTYGYNFTVNKTGAITKICINVHNVNAGYNAKIWTSSGTLLSNTSMTGITDSWTCSNVYVPVTSGSSYITSVNGTFPSINASSVATPFTVQDIVVNNGVSTSTATFAPNISSSTVWGLPDIVFTPNQYPALNISN